MSLIGKVTEFFKGSDYTCDADKYETNKIQIKGQAPKTSEQERSLREALANNPNGWQTIQPRRSSK